MNLIDTTTNKLGQVVAKHPTTIINLWLIGVLALFSADGVLGAVGLRAFYNPVGMASAVLCGAALLFLRLRKNLSPRGTLIYLSVALFIGLIVAITPIRILMIVIGWFTGIIFGGMFIPPAIILGIVLISFLIQRRASHTATKVPSHVTTLTTLSLLFCGGYFSGFAATPAYAEAEIADRFIHNHHQYFLYRKIGWLGDPDTLRLYECNQLGFDCRIIYEAPTGYYRRLQPSIVVDAQTKTVGVEIDGKFSPVELTAADVEYLCQFFDFPATYWFCDSYQFQDFADLRYALDWKLGTLNYDDIVPYFERAQTFNPSDCPSPDAKNPDNLWSYECKLRFPDRSQYLILSVDYQYRGIHDIRIGDQ